MKNILELGSIVTAMITPFNHQNEVNLEQAIHIADYLIENDTSCLLVTGTTGESPTLSHDEEYALYEAFVKRFKGKTPIMAGTGSNSTKTAIESTRRAAEIGVDCSLQVVPYYNKPSQAGIIAHFEAIAAATDLPIILYDIPGRTGRGMEIETILHLAKNPKIVGLKDASGSLDNFHQYKDQLPADFLVYSGDDALTADFVKEGAFGVVSVASHICGKQITQLMQAAQNNELDKLERLKDLLNPLFEILFLTPNPCPVKHALKLIGFPCGEPRLPLLAVNEEEAESIESVLDHFLDQLEPGGALKI